MSDLPQPSGLSDQQISDLTAAFYRRVREDDLIGPMSPTMIGREPSSVCGTF